MLGGFQISSTDHDESAEGLGPDYRLAAAVKGIADHLELCTVGEIARQGQSAPPTLHLPGESLIGRNLSGGDIRAPDRVDTIGCRAVVERPDSDGRD